MGARKRNMADRLKKERKNIVSAKLNNCPTSPRKMRLVADQIRGTDVNQALDILKYSPKEASRRLEKLLLSAISNWEVKNERSIKDEDEVYVSNIHVDSGRILKRLRPAPQGRAYRIRKSSNHVTLVLGSRTLEMMEEEEELEEEEILEEEELEEEEILEKEELEEEVEEDSEEERDEPEEEEEEGEEEEEEKETRKKKR
mgnify:FL=1